MRRRTSYLIIVLLIAIVGGGAVVLIGTSSPHTSDSALIKKFSEHEADFNLLMKMAGDDAKASIIRMGFVGLGNEVDWPPTIYLYEDKVWPRLESELGFSQQRWDEYRRLFKKLNLHGIDRKPEMPDVVFFTASMDFSPLDDYESAVTEKGYVYRPKGIQHSLTGSLDGLKIDHPAMFFKRLNDHDQRNT
jgi:hypothetical protein